MVQVVNTDRHKIANTNEKIVTVNNGHMICFSAINHVYFYSQDVAILSTQTTVKGLETFNIIYFEFGAQSYSRLNSLIKFNFDMAQP